MGCHVVSRPMQSALREENDVLLEHIAFYMKL